MNKIVTNALIVGTQLIVGGLFLFMLFSDNNEDSRVVVVNNNNLNKMADSVNELFVVDHTVVENTVDDVSEQELISVEEKQRQEEEAKKKAAEEEARRIAEEEAKKAAEEEAKRKAAEEEAAKNAVTVDATGYISKPGMGFNVTTGNRTYSLSDNDFNVVAGVVACEAAGKDDALAVMSVILNRADTGRYGSPVGVVTAAGQFSCINHPGDPSRYASVVSDALNGVRNNKYTSFNCPGCSPNIANYIVDGGNWYY